MRASLPVDEAERVAALHRLGVLDQPPSPDLDSLTRLAAHVADTPTSFINLIDSDRQWQAAACGAERGEFAREDSLCQHVVADGEGIYVTDASADPRFKDSPFVTGDIDQIRLYCGIPLRDQDGFMLGTLCVTDSRVRGLSADQRTALADLARQVECQFELRRQHDKLLDLLSAADHAASHDALTGLANRRVVTDRIDHALQRMVRGAQPPVVFFCDLNRFKAVNDTFGHDAGDEVLIEVGRRLRRCFRPSDTVSRLGGDEFVVLCEDLPAGQRGALVERIRSLAEAPVRTEDAIISIGIGIGIAVAWPGATVRELLVEADRRMYDDKPDRPVVADPA